MRGRRVGPPSPPVRRRRCFLAGVSASARPESPKGGRGRGTRPGVLGEVLPPRAALALQPSGAGTKRLQGPDPGGRITASPPHPTRRGRRAAGSRCGRGGGGGAALSEAGVCEGVSRKVAQAPREDDGAAALTVPRAGGRGRGAQESGLAQPPQSPAPPSASNRILTAPRDARSAQEQARGTRAACVTGRRGEESRGLAPRPGAPLARRRGRAAEPPAQPQASVRRRGASRPEPPPPSRSLRLRGRRGPAPAGRGPSAGAGLAGPRLRGAAPSASVRRAGAAAGPARCGATCAWRCCAWPAASARSSTPSASSPCPRRVERAAVAGSHRPQRLLGSRPADAAPREGRAARAPRRIPAGRTGTGRSLSRGRARAGAAGAGSGAWGSAWDRWQVRPAPQDSLPPLRPPSRIPLLPGNPTLFPHPLPLHPGARPPFRIPLLLHPSAAPA